MPNCKKRTHKLKRNRFSYFQYLYTNKVNKKLYVHLLWWKYKSSVMESNMFYYSRPNYAWCPNWRPTGWLPRVLLTLRHQRGWKDSGKLKIMFFFICPLFFTIWIWFYSFTYLFSQNDSTAYSLSSIFISICLSINQSIYLSFMK